MQVWNNTQLNVYCFRGLCMLLRRCVAQHIHISVLAGTAQSQGQGKMVFIMEVLL